MASQMASQVLDKGWELPDRVTDFNKVSASSSFLSIIALRENDHDEEAGDRMGYPDYPKFTCRQCRAIVFRVPEPASAHSRNRLSSTPHPATEIHRSSRTRAACGSTRNTRRASPAPENTTCIHSPHKCPCPSARGLDTSGENRVPNTAAGPVQPTPPRCPHTRSDSRRTISPAAPDRFHETPDAPQ